ncbi:hypothetical protein [Oribacterium sp. WCC10]|uniref:hypothetical protein n=1 Tax=Oribacterium sp. WCC10 TaxID=1855343 RepID=UPI0008E5546E|nr:hypothetical protein [Oribacterium sp. WCC10]SFG25703.1 hypothetical protein SAMN05216356_104109 [Oribacterium sp. WCC10]
MIICEALHIRPELLLVGISGEVDTDKICEPDELDMKIMEETRKLSDGQKKRILAYMSMLQNMKKKNRQEEVVEQF